MVAQVMSGQYHHPEIQRHDKDIRIGLTWCSLLFKNFKQRIQRNNNLLWETHQDDQLRRHLVHDL
jgi:hypothetical protein